MDVVKKVFSVEPHPVPAIMGISGAHSSRDYEERLPGINVFHLASVSSEKKSDVFCGVNDMSDSHFTTFMGTA